MSRRASYRDVKQQVLGRIRTGEWSPGALIPKEQALADGFGCSRLTVHRALRELADEGVVERRRRAGTRVALQNSSTAQFEITRIDREIEATGARYRYRRILQRQASASPGVADKLGLETRDERSRVVEVECVHFANDVPFQLEHRWINLRAVPEAAEASFASTPPNVWLLERAPWSEVEHVISAANASAAEARQLDVAAGDALMVVERRSFIGDEVVTFARMLHPGSFYRLRAGGQR